MIKIELQMVFIIIALIAILIGGVYGTYLFYLVSKPYNNLDSLCVLLSLLLHCIIGMIIIVGLSELSKKTIEIDINKLKENLKQIIK